MKKIVITAAAHPVLVASFLAAGYDVVESPQITYDELLKIAPSIHGLVVTTRIKVDETFLQAAPNLQWIGRLGSGMELIDTQFAASRGIQCFSTPEGNCTAVGEHALMLLLASKRNLYRAVSEVKENIWKRNENRGTEVYGKKVGIIGFGHTGSAFSNAVSGLGATVMAYDKYKTGFNSDKVKEVSLEEIQHAADVISFHLPLAEETRYFFNEDFATKLVNSPLIINTSRGAVIDQAALLAALHDNRISGAALDVLEAEKINKLTADQELIFNQLQRHPAVLITPHIAGYTHESFYKMSSVLLKKLSIPESGN